MNNKKGRFPGLFFERNLLFNFPVVLNRGKFFEIILIQKSKFTLRI